MDINLTNMTSIAQCDARIQEAQEERFEHSNAVQRNTYLISQKAAVVVRAQNILSVVNTRIEDLTTQIDSMPAGPDKEKLIGRRYNELARKQRMTVILGEDNAALDLDRQIALSRAESAIVEIDARITAFQAKKVELQNAAA